MKKLLLVIFLFGIVGAVNAVVYPYWIEDDGNNNYSIWTKLNILADSSKTIYIQKVSGYSPDGSSVFDYFDDFSETKPRNL